MGFAPLSPTQSFELFSEVEDICHRRYIGNQLFQPASKGCRVVNPYEEQGLEILRKPGKDIPLDFVNRQGRLTLSGRFVIDGSAAKQGLSRGFKMSSRDSHRRSSCSLLGRGFPKAVCGRYALHLSS